MGTSALIWTGRILTALFALFILGASVAPKLLRLPVAEETMAQLGWPPGYAFLIGIIEFTCLVLYLIPHQRPWRGADDGVARRRDGDPDPRRQPPLQPHPVQHLPWAVHVGRPMAARSPREGAVSRCQGALRHHHLIPKGRKASPAWDRRLDTPEPELTASSMQLLPPAP